MAKVITFSRIFPKYHPKAGLGTFFVEQILNSLKIDFRDIKYQNTLMLLNIRHLNDGKLTEDDIVRFRCSLATAEYEHKLHTMRAGERFKEGEKFSPRVWSGTPYDSPQIIFAPEQVVFKTYPVQLINSLFLIHGKNIDLEILQRVIENDGFCDVDDFYSWFYDDFEGQIIAWDKNVNY